MCVLFESLWLQQEHQGLAKRFSTSSNVCPLVSGRRHRKNIKPREAIPTNSQYVPANKYYKEFDYCEPKLTAVFI